MHEVQVKPNFPHCEIAFARKMFSLAFETGLVALGKHEH
jgi:hypothetical protein